MKTYTLSHELESTIDCFSEEKEGFNRSLSHLTHVGARPVRINEFHCNSYE